MTDYGRKVADIVNSTLVGVSLSLSKDVGILQALIDAPKPLTSNEIADKKELKERYVREILNCLATAEIIHASNNEAGSLVYHLDDEEKKVFMTSVIAFSSFPAVLAILYDEVKNCLPKNGPYSVRYSDAAHNCIEEFSVHSLGPFVNTTLEHVDGLKDKLESGIEVIEFGCGRGRLMARFAQMFPKSTFTASEVVSFLLEQLKSNLGHIPNIQYEINDLCSLPDPPAKKYDWVYCTDVIHDLPNPLEALKGIRKLVKDNGIFTMIDMATSGSPIEDRGNLGVASLYAASTFLCIPESYQREDSQALGACWGKQTAVKLAETAGFNVKVVAIEGFLALYICQP